MVRIWKQIELLVLGKRYVISYIYMMETGTDKALRYFLWW